MDRCTKRFFSSAALAIALCAGASYAAPMPPEEFDAAIKAYDERFAEARKGGLKLEDALAIQAEFSPRFPIGDLMLDQLRALSTRNLITTYKPGGEHDRTKEAIAVLEPLTRTGGVDAVEALAFKARLLDSNNAELEGEMLETVGRVLTHRRFHEAIRENRAQSIWYTIGYGVSKERLPELAEELAMAAARMPSDAPPQSLAGMTTVYEKALATEDAATRNAADDLRVKAIGALQRAMAGEDEAAKAAAKRELGSLEAAPKIASLVGSLAPELDFEWSTRGESLTSLADLRGKVVILDFWATWCGPCVATFPQIRELVAHYAGYPVEIVGVTSVQGATHFKEGQEKAETPEQEYEQMTRYIDEREITWTVGFTSQEVFNPEYGVRGIPHVVILDPDGKIRHRALHPSSPLHKKAQLIDPILKEFGITPPPAPPEPAPAPDTEGEAKKD